MKYDDLDKTKDLFDIDSDVPSPIENIEQEGASKENLTDEFTLGLRETNEVPKVEEPNKKEKKEKKNLKKWWSSLSKKKKIIFIISLILIVALIVGIILYFCLNKEEPEKEEPKAPEVIIEKENYIYKDGNLSLLNSEEKEIGTYECKNKSEVLCYVAYYSNEDNFDVPKNIYEDETSLERRSSIYLEQYVFIYDNEKEKEETLILYNLKEQKIEGVYSLIKGYNSSNEVIVKDNNKKYGILEFNEEGIHKKIDFTFDYLGMMSKDSKIVAKTNNKYFIYNKEGKLESKGLTSEIKSYNNNYIAVNNDGYYIYDYKGNLTYDDKYDYVKLLDNYAVLIKDQKLYIKDYNNNKYNEEGIELGNIYYNETNIYKEDKSLKETNYSFKVEEVEGNLEITYNAKNNKEKTITIFTNEGKLSSLYAYLNYFNGKLYFYNDEEEKNLIGTYTCSNKNTTDKDTKELTNCYIASDSFYSKNETSADNSSNVGWIPIYNERYVFIVDVIDPKNETILLYDLKNNKTLSKYISVDSASYTKDKKITFKKTDNTYIMAKNKNNKYGVIKIEEEVKSAIPFNYNYIEKLKEYYMVGDSAGTYQLLNSTGSEVTSKYGHKIIDYKDKYLKVLNEKDNKYYVYDFNGNSIEETGYYYISLDSDYYVVINTEKKLDIHKYNNTSFHLNTTIAIETDDYKNAFEVSKASSGEFIVKIKATNTTYNFDVNGNIKE